MLLTLCEAFCLQLVIFRTLWVIDFTTRLVKLASFLLVNLPYDAFKTILKSILYKYFLYFMSHSGFQISSKWVQNRISRENGTTWLHLPATGCYNSCWIFSAAWWTHMNGLWIINYDSRIMSNHWSQFGHNISS